MTERSQEAKEVIVAVGLSALVIWILFHYMKGSGPVQQSAAPLPSLSAPSAVIPFAFSPIAPLSTAPVVADPCSCTSGCNSNPNVIGSLAQIQATGLSAANAIIAAGNATLEAIALIAAQNDPLLQVTVG